MVMLNGRTYTLAILTGTAGYAYTAPDDRGLPLWPEAVMTDMLAELDAVKSPGGMISGSLGLSVGNQGFTLAQSASLPAGLYFLHRTSEGNVPVNAAYASIGTAIVAGTAGTLTISSGAVIGTGGTYGDLVLEPASTRRPPLRSGTGDLTVLLTDFNGQIRYLGTGGNTVTWPALGTLGAPFQAYLVHDGTGTLHIDPAGTRTIDGAGTIGLTVGQRVLLSDNGTDIRSLSAKGYGAPSATLAFTVKTASYTGTLGDRLIMDCTGTSLIFTAPVAAPVAGGEPMLLQKLGTNLLSLAFGTNAAQLPNGTFGTGTHTVTGAFNRLITIAPVGTSASGVTKVWSLSV